jgi:hypothetical protein
MVSVEAIRDNPSHLTIRRLNSQAFTYFFIILHPPFTSSTDHSRTPLKYQKDQFLLNY